MGRDARRPRRRDRRPHRSTPAGSHRPVLLREVLAVLAPAPGEVAVDCTLGAGGHAAELLRAVGPGGLLIGLDLDGTHLDAVRQRLAEVGGRFALHHTNFAAVPSVLADAGLDGCDVLLADLGMSSMQIDDAARGFSYSRDGALDMRMNPSRGQTAAELLASISAAELAAALRELGDEPAAEVIADAVVAAFRRDPPRGTRELAQIIQDAVGRADWRLHPAPGQWQTHPAARTFQALRILVNRELASLDALLRSLPACLKPGGRAAIISFHSGEDRRVKGAFRDGLQAGLYAEISPEPIRPTFGERNDNPRSRSAKLRWARRA